MTYAPRRRSLLSAAAALLFVAALLGGWLALAGCKPLVVRAELANPIEVKAALQSVTYEGTFVSEQLFTEVDIGDTTEAYLIALLGEADRRTDLGDGRTLLLYRYRPTEQSAPLVSLLGTGGELDPQFVTTAFEIEGGMVVEKIRG